MNQSVFISSRPHIRRQQRRDQWTAEAKRIFSLTITAGLLALGYLVLIGLTGTTV
jgi:hypothetical protein